MGWNRIWVFEDPSWNIHSRCVLCDKSTWPVLRIWQLSVIYHHSFLSTRAEIHKRSNVTHECAVRDHQGCSTTSPDIIYFVWKFWGGGRRQFHIFVGWPAFCNVVFNLNHVHHNKNTIVCWFSQAEHRYDFASRWLAADTRHVASWSLPRFPCCIGMLAEWHPEKCGTFLMLNFDMSTSFFVFF